MTHENLDVAFLEAAKVLENSAAVLRALAERVSAPAAPVPAAPADEPAKPKSVEDVRELVNHVLSDLGDPSVMGFTKSEISKYVAGGKLADLDTEAITAIWYAIREKYNVF